MKLFCSSCNKVMDTAITEGAKEVQCPNCSNMINVPESPLSPGAVIGDFLLEKSLSSGGMGVVYLARQISLDRPVALKVLHDKFAGNQEYIEGLFREARAAAKLTHPNIVQAYAVGEENGIFYFAMEYIRGETFKQILKKQTILPFAQATKVIREICSALQAAWNEQKLVHQDIKPDNIMLDSNGFAKLADLGLARSANNDSNPGENETEVMGTPQYISPEQLTGVPTDVRSDIYSLGATFYQFVTGQFPYPAESAELMAHKHVEGNLTPPIEVNPELPQGLNDIIVKMMARHIEDRYQSPNEVIAALDAYLELKKISSMPVPKIKLSLNKKPSAPAPAKPGVPGKMPLPGIPKTTAKPAAAPTVSKPAAPPAAKPAAPPAAKPAAPPAAKPATPPAAKPAAPPAAKPATPPAAPQAEPPAPKEPEQIAPSPEKSTAETPSPESSGADNNADPTLAPSKRTKPQDPADGKEGAEKKENSNSQNKKRKRGSGKSIVRTIFLLLCVLFILAAAAFVLYLVAQKGHLGAKGKTIVAGINKKLGIKASPSTPDKDVKQPSLAAQTAAQPAAPKPVPVPKTRPEVISETDRLISFYRVNPPQNSLKFLQETDSFTARFKAPLTDEEKKAFLNLYRIYDTVDDVVRAQPYRKKVIHEIEERLKARVLEAQRAKKISEEQIKKVTVNVQLSDNKDDKANKERDIRVRKLQKDFNTLYRKLAAAFMKSVRANDPKPYKTAVSEAESPFTVIHVTQREYDMEEEFRSFRDRFLPKAYSQFEKFHRDIRKITPSNSFTMGDYLEIEVIRVEAPEVIYKSSRNNKGERKLNLNPPRRRAEFYRHMIRKTKNPHIPFFFEFIEGRIIAPLTPKSVPSKEWERHLKHLCPPVKAVWARPVVKKAPAKKVVRKAPAKRVVRKAPAKRVVRKAVPQKKAAVRKAPAKKAPPEKK